MPKVSEVIDHLQRNYDGDVHIAAPIWCEYDVQKRALERHVSITIEQARSIIDQMDANHNAEIGITWDTIDCGLAAVDELEEPEE